MPSKRASQNKQNEYDMSENILKRRMLKILTGLFFFVSIPTILLARLANPQMSLFFIAAILIPAALAFWLSYTSHHRISRSVLLLIIPVLLWLSALQDALPANYSLYYFVVIVILAACFYSYRATLIAILISILSLFLIPQLPSSTLQFNTGMIYSQIVLVIISGIVLTLYSRYRDQLETERIRFIQTRNQQVQQIQDRFRTLVENSPDYIIIVDADYTITYLNRYADSTDVNEIIGSSIFDYSPKADHDKLRQMCETARRTGQSVTFEQEAYRQDGTARWFRTRVAPFHHTENDRLDLMLVSTDITEAKKAEQAFLDTRNQLQLVINNTPVILFMLDQDGIFQLSEGAGLQTLGLQPGQVVGLSAFDLYQNVDGFAERFQRVLDGETVEWVAGRENVYFYTVYYPRYDADGHIIGIFGASYDITQQKLLQDELRQQKAQLEEQVNVQTLAIRETLQAEKEQRQMAEALLAIPQTLAETVEVNAILSSILANLSKVVSHDYAQILLTDGETIKLGACRGCRDNTMPDDKQLLRRYPLLAAIYESQKPVMTDDITLSNLAMQSPFHVHATGGFLGVPVLINKQVTGFIIVMSDTPHYFQQIHQDRLRLFATQVALAVKVAHMYEDIQAQAIVDERQRIARDLHDAVSQTLFSASMIAQSLPRFLDDNPRDVRSGLKQLDQLTSSAIAEMRNLLFELRPQSLVTTPLDDLLLYLVDSARVRFPGDITYHVDGLFIFKLPTNVKINIYRLAQEALNNILKHARATHIYISLELTNRIMLIIEDNGRGFDVSQKKFCGLGLTIMQERANAEGISLEIQSQSDQGAKITITWEANHYDR